MVIDHALGVAGGAGGVVEADGLPLVRRPLPGEFGIAFGEEGLVVQIADRLAFAVLGVVDVDHQRRMVEHADGGVNHVEELAVGDHHLGFAVLQHERDGFGIQAHVEGVEHRADHRHAEMHFEHRRDVRQHHRHRVALADATAGQCRGQAPAARVGLGPVATNRTMHYGRVVRVYRRCTFDEAQWAEGNMVDGGAAEALLVDRHGGYTFG